MQYRHTHAIDGKGAVRGIAVDGHGRGEVYAACEAEIRVFDSAGRLARRWPTSRPAWSVAVAADGVVYSGELGQIEIFHPAGKLIDTWRDDKLLRRVTAIGFSGASVLAGDSADRAIRRFDRSGRFLNTIGKDNPLGGLLIPNGVVDFGVDREGTVYAANPGKHRVERYTPEGKLLGHIGRFDGIDPAGFTGCCNPTNVAIGDAIYTAEKAGPRVKAYDFGGKLLAVIAADLFDANCKNMDIAVDARSRIYVVDTVKSVILVFERVGA